MKIKELKSPRLADIGMKCDKIIHKKLLEYPMIENCFSTSNYTLICGKMGSGKTSLVLKILTNIYNKCFENIYVIMPAISRKSVENDIFGKELPSDCLYDDLSTEILDEIYHKVTDNSNNDEYSLVIIDDYQYKLKQKEIAEALELFVIKIRHLRCSVFFLCQNYNKTPKNLRQLVSNLIFFDMGKSQNETIFEEVMPISKNEFLQLMKTGFTNKHDFLCLDLRHNKIFKNFNQEIEL
jgi:hypothetical protein